MQDLSVSADDTGLVVKAEVARKQIDAEVPSPTPAPIPGVTPTAGDPIGTGAGVLPPVAPAKQIPRRYHGSVTLNPTRAGRDASVIAEEVIAHLAGLMGANVKVTMEIEVDVPDGVPDTVVRVVTENGRTLKFDVHGFEAE
jgi:hypothetical protein